jgi:hypothetical protein
MQREVHVALVDSAESVHHLPIAVDLKNMSVTSVEGEQHLMYLQEDRNAVQQDAQQWI